MVEEGFYMDDKLYNAARHSGTDIQNFLTDELFRIRTIGDESNALHVAAQHGNLAFINTVLKELPDHHFHLLCKQNSQGETPLHLAAELGNSEIVETLLRAHDKNSVPFDERKPCWSVWDKRGDTPAHRALKYGNEGVALSLLEKDMQLVSVCNNASESLAYLAAENFCQKFMEEILKAHRYDPSSVSFSGPFERTVFHPARKLNGNIMSTLIERRTYLLKAQERNTKKTVLHYAVEEHMELLVKTLLMADSTLAYLHDKDGMTPLHRAAKMGSPRMIRIILELSPQSLTILDKINGQTALHIAKMDASSLAGCLKSTRMKELINVTDKNGNTPLHLALINSDLASANKLLEVETVNWRLTNEQGHSPIDLCTSDDQIPFKLKCLASTCRVKEVVTNTQIFHKAVINNVDDLLDHYSWEDCLEYRGPRGDNILHVAARDGQRNIINQAHSSASDILLLLSGQNSKGETPLHLAAQHGQLEVVNSILSLCTPINKPKNDDNPSTFVPIDSENENKLMDIKPWRMKSNNGETPIHKALINKHENIALRLLSYEPELVSSENSANDNLLYHAAEYCCNRVLEEIVSRTGGYNTLCTRGPNGQNVIHAAAKSGAKIFDLCMSLIERQPNLINEVDDYGKTPLHYAVEEWEWGVVTKLLKEDRASAFIYDNDGFTPLLRAGVVGVMPTIKSILDLCPQSAELRDGNDRTVLHLAEVHGLFFKTCMKHQVMLKLINETDKEGNTALHCAILNEKIHKASVLLRTKGINWKIRNKQHKSPMDLCYELKRSGKTNQLPILAMLDLLNKEELPPTRAQKYGLNVIKMFKDLLLLTEDNVKKLLEKIAVAAALLVAITFAAAFSVPMGGYDQNTGDGKKVNQVAVNVFIVSDVFAMLMAISILLKYTLIEVRPDMLYHLAMTSIFLLRMSLGFTIVAFLSGVYAIVSHGKLLILIPIIVAALLHSLMRIKLEFTGFTFF